MLPSSGQEQQVNGAVAPGCCPTRQAFDDIVDGGALNLSGSLAIGDYLIHGCWGTMDGGTSGKRSEKYQADQKPSRKNKRTNHL